MTSFSVMDTPASVPERRSVITTIARFAADRWQATLALFAVVLGLGLFSYFGGLAREGFPPVNLPIVVVDGSYFVDDPDLVDADVTSPIGEAFADAEGVSTITTVALDSFFAVIVEFEDTFSSPEGAAILSDAITAVDLPVEATVDVRSLDATKFLDTYDLLVSISGPDSATPQELEAEAAKLEAFLAEAPEIAGAETRNLLTEGLDPATGEQITRQTRFTRVAIGGEVGSNGYNEAIAIGLIRAAGEDLDILSFSDAVNSRLDSQDVLSPGFTGAVTADFATDIRAQLSNLTGNLLTGLLAVAAVSLLLIGWRVSLITALFMATVVMAALTGLWVFGYSLNTITLFGLILTLGLLVDDAIVISESLDANREPGAEPLGIVRKAINRVGSASFSGTLTTVLVFAPMAFVGGILGEFIRAIPITVIITLLASFTFSIIFIPAIARFALLNAGPSRNPIVKAEARIAEGLGRLARFPATHGPLGVLAGFAVVAAGVGVIFASFGIAASLGFNIFPPTKDGNAILITAEPPFGSTIEDVEESSREIDGILISTLGDDLLRSQYIRANERTVETFVDLVRFETRDTTSPEYVERLEEQFASIPGFRIKVQPLEAGPPVEEFPWAAQIVVSDATVAAAEELALDMAAALKGLDLNKTTGDPANIADTTVSSLGQVVRVDGVRQVEVRASFSNDDLTNNLDAAEVLAQELFPASDLEARGLSADALGFDYGLESDNQEDFASLGQALMIALGLMFLLLVFQFRSIVQPLLIFLAIPFSFFGVFSSLSLTDNPISFFVAVGFIALIGVVVNNTILLVDAANQNRRIGHNAADSIAEAVSSRFRPLVATTVTTVVGLLPLALSNPFWEALSFTLMGGLVSSTILVLLVFPVIYLGVETIRTPVRNLGRKVLRWDPIG